jgi:3-oxoadipate CoA-transferase alpha subunit
MISKVIDTVAEALGGVVDGSTILVGGFGLAGHPVALIEGLLEQGARDLTIVSNNAGNGDTGLAALLAAHRVRKIVCSFPRQSDSWHFDRLYRARELELELVPQGNLAERLRAAGAGIGAFYTPIGAGTELSSGKETREIEGREHVLEFPIHGDLALVGAWHGDRWGNLIYRKTSQNFNPLMAAAATVTVAQVDKIVELGELDPEAVVTPGIYVDKVVAVGARPWMRANRLVSATASAEQRS